LVLDDNRILSYLAVMESLEAETRKIDSLLERYRPFPGVINLQTIPGIGLLSALVIYFEIGDIQR
jgi:transposase